LIPLERELQERLAWFIRLRWLAAAGILLGTWAMASLTLLNLSPWPLYGVGLAVSSYNAVFLLLYRRLRAGNAAPRTHRQSVYAQIALDWICLICLVHYSGGIQSPVVLAFIFHLIIGAILLPRWACYLQAALASLLMVVLLLVEHLGTWPPVVVADPRLTPLGGLLTDLWRWIVLTVLLGVTAFLTTSIIVPLRRKEQVLFRSERSLDQAYGEMETLYQVGQAVNATLDQEQVLGLIAENGARLMGMKACSIRLLDGSGRFLRVGAAYGLSRAYLDKGPVEVGKSRIDDEALAGRTVQIAQVGSDSRVQYPEEARQEGIHAILCAPMQARGRSIGCIRVYSGEPHQFSRDEESFLLNLANLGAVAIENARAYTELQELSEERAWFARVTHHQLRAPLAAVRAMLDALRFAGPLNEKQVDFIGRSRRRTDELLEMIRDLLDLAAAQRPLAERPAEPVALLTSLERTLETLRARATHKGVALEIHLPAEIRVLAEAEDLERIFANLMDNAVKYTPTGGKVNLEVRQEGDQVVGRVRDTGIGIANEDQESVFRGFYRTQEAKATGELGTGIGLSIVKKLVTRWGGNLELESAAGQGSQFTVRLPATGGQTAAP
jgi:signal transduction histidine kinase